MVHFFKNKFALLKNNIIWWRNPVLFRCYVMLSIFCQVQAVCYLGTRLSLKNDFEIPFTIQNIGCLSSDWIVRKNRKKASESSFLCILCVVAFFPICAYTRIVCALTAGSFFWSRSFLYAYTCWLRKLRKKPINLDFFKKVARILNKTIFGANRTC